MTAPVYGTVRRADRATTGAHGRKVARGLGVTLLDWQQQTLDVAGELTADPDTGRPVHAYHTVTVSVGRRAGKSLLTLVRLLTAAIGAQHRRAWYTAQSRSDAAVTMRDEWVPMVSMSRLGPLVRPRESNGSEALTVPGRGSIIRLFAPTGTSLHGQAGDLIVFDEAWAHTAARGVELQTAARPLMATRPGAQQWILSAAGTSDSTWWLELLDRGRTAAQSDVGRGHCHMEWTADGTDLDPADPATWRRVHPAVRHPGNPNGTISVDWLADEYAADPAMFARQYLNITDRTGATVTGLDRDVWDRLAVPPPDRTGTMVLGVDCAPDQAATALVVCHHDGTTPIVELVEHRSGHGWAPRRITELVDRHGLHTVVLDRGSAAGALWGPLAAAGVPLTDAGLRDITAAAAQMVEAVTTGTIRHVPHPALDAAVAAARRRSIGDGAWTWGRRDTDSDVSPLVAATLARWAHPELHGVHAAVY